MKITGTDGKEYTIEPEANLNGADLRGADLGGADLSKANLSGADLSKVSLTDVYLEGAVWNDNTVFPEGFEIPEKSGT